jgi:hypothetical protein
MSNRYNFIITAGLPVAKEFVATLPDDRDWWADPSDFEVRMHVRDRPSPLGALVIDLTPYLTVTMPSADVVNVKFSMTGADTRAFLRGGYYDVQISDPLVTDSRIYQLSTGRIDRRALVSSETSPV